MAVVTGITPCVAGSEMDDLPAPSPQRLPFDVLFALARRHALRPMRLAEIQALELQHRSDLSRLALIEGFERFQRTLIMALAQEKQPLSRVIQHAATNTDEIAISGCSPRSFFEDPSSVVSPTRPIPSIPADGAATLPPQVPSVPADSAAALPAMTPQVPSVPVDSAATVPATTPRVVSVDLSLITDAESPPGTASASQDASVEGGEVSQWLVRARFATLTLDAIGGVEPLARQSLADEEAAARETLLLRRLVGLMELQQRQAAANNATAASGPDIGGAAHVDTTAVLGALGRAVAALEQSHRAAIDVAALVAASLLGCDMLRSMEDACRAALESAAAVCFMSAHEAEEAEDQMLHSSGGATARPHNGSGRAAAAAAGTLGSPLHGPGAIDPTFSYGEISSGGAGTCSDVEWNEHSSVSSTASIRPDRTAWV